MNNKSKRPIDLHAENVEAILKKIELNGINEISEDLIQSLSALKTAGDLRWIRYRARLKKFPDICIGDIEKIISSSSGESSNKSGDDSEPYINVVDELVDMARSSGTLFMGTDGEPYFEMELETHREVIALKSADMREWAAFQFFQTYRKTPKAPQIADAINSLGGFANYDGEVHEVALRVAIAPDGGYLLDCCDETWRTIHLSKNGYKILDRSPVRFRRTSRCKPLIVPENHGTLDDLRALINVAKKDLILLVPAILEALRPDTAYPVIEIVGEQGSAKSTTQQTLTSFFDPKSVGLRSRPGKTEDLFIAARSNHVVHYNNLSGLSADMQDGLCCLSTGGGFASRKLYTDDEEAVFDAKRPVYLNGITILATQPDLMSRVLQIRCPVLKDSDRISDQEVLDRIANHGPKALDYLLTTFCKALGVLPDVKIDKPPRLMDYAKFGVAVASVMAKDNPDLFKNNSEEPFMTRYREQLDTAVKQSLESSPDIEALVDFLESKSGYIESTVGQLHEDLVDRYGFRKYGWSKTPRGFRNRLDRSKPALRAMGIELEFPHSRRNGQAIIVTYSHDKFSLPTTSQHSPSSLDTILKCELDKARECRERRDRYPSKRLETTEEEIEEMHFWQDVDHFASPEDISASDFLKEGGGLDI